MGGFVADEADRSQPEWRGRDVASYDTDDGTEHGSLRIDAPPRWKDVSDTHGHKKTLTDSEIARAIERRFGISPSTHQKSSSISQKVDSITKSAHIAMAGAAIHVAKHTSNSIEMSVSVLVSHSRNPSSSAIKSGRPILKQN